MPTVNIAGSFQQDVEQDKQGRDPRLEKSGDESWTDYVKRLYSLAEDCVADEETMVALDDGTIDELEERVEKVLQRFEEG